MTMAQDKLNCIRNLIQMMCSDGRIEESEKRFLFKAAKALQEEVEDWNALLDEVRQEPGKLYPLQERDRAISALKAMVVMAKVDQHVDAKEGALIRRFAESIGLSNQEWKQILHDLDIPTLFEPFRSRQIAGTLVILKEDFDKLDAFLTVLKDSEVRFRLEDFDAFVRAGEVREQKVCFHAAPVKEKTVQKCQTLLEKCGDKLIAILTRFQGNQVQYLLERGLKKCIIEPVYKRDLEQMFSGK